MSRIPWASRNVVTAKEVGLEFGEVRSTLRAIVARLTALEKQASTSFSDSPLSLNIRRDSVPVTAGSNTITFSSALSTTNYALSSLPVFVSSTETAQANLNAKSTTGFTCYSPSAGTLDYTAIEIA
jgi:hypothetical protein